MITGAHAIVFSEQAEAARVFIRDVLGLDSVDAGGGWRIFALPPAEVAIHPGPPRHELYLMCDDLETTVAELESRGAEIVGPVNEQPWGRLTAIALPGGGEIGLYEPNHPRPI